MDNFLEKMKKQKFRSFMLVFWLLFLPVDLFMHHFLWCFADILFIAYFFSVINSDSES